MKNLEIFEKKYLEKIKQTKKIPDFNSGDTVTRALAKANLLTNLKELTPQEKLNLLNALKESKK